jgi:putative acetyltransferase
MSITPEIVISQASPEDAAAIWELQRESVFALAASAYPREVLDEWAPGAGQERIETLKRGIEGGSTSVLIASINEQMAGFAIIDIKIGELRSLFVHPNFAKIGVGSALLRASEALAIKAGRTEVTLDASVNAKSFYLKHGYILSEPICHFLNSGRKMICFSMKKRLNKKSAPVCESKQPA